MPVKQHEQRSFSVNASHCDSDARTVFYFSEDDAVKFAHQLLADARRIAQKLQLAAVRGVTHRCG
jgi:hypothetical protein